MKCMVLCCRNSRRYTRGKSFFRFPKKKILCDQWLKEIGRDSCPVSENSNVCEDHFAKDLMGTRRTRKILENGAIPEHLFKECEKCSTYQLAFCEYLLD